MSYKGLYKPQNPNKYKGDPTKIVYRSLWELSVQQYLDNNSNVLEWASEEFCIPYRSPLDGVMHRYFPDFWVKKVNKQGEIDIIVIEVKPKSQTLPPKVQTRKTKRYLTEVRTYAVNQAKWAAAEEFCKKRGWKFVKMTEEEIYGKKK